MRKITKWIHGQIDYRDRYNPPNVIYKLLKEKE